jgi:Tol biopolymer transport system component
LRIIDSMNISRRHLRRLLPVLLVSCAATALLGSGNSAVKLPANIFLTEDGALKVSSPSSSPRMLIEDQDFNWILDWTKGRVLASGKADGLPSALLLVEADGSTSVLSDRAGVARFSPDGKSVLFTRELVLYVRRLADSAPIEAVPGVLDASWAPDGKSIVLIRIDPEAEERHWLALYDLRSGTTRDLTGRPFNDWSPWFHPSGDWILFASTRDPYGHSALWRIGTDGEALAQLTNLSGEPQVPTPSSRAIWSPDGQRLAFDAVNEDGSRSIWAITFSREGTVDHAEQIGSGIPYSWLNSRQLLAVPSGDESSPVVVGVDR